jgi:hypothetical protein
LDEGDLCSGLGLDIKGYCKLKALAAVANTPANKIVERILTWL